MQGETALRPRFGGPKCAAPFPFSPPSSSSSSPLLRPRGAAPSRRLRRPELRLRRTRGEHEGPRRLGDARPDAGAQRHRRARRRLDRTWRDDAGPGRSRRMAPDGLRRIPAGRLEPDVLRGDRRRLLAAVRRARPQRGRRRIAPLRGARDGEPELVVARLGRRQARQPADPPARAATTRGTRRPSPRTGTAAPAPATPTPTASRTSRSPRTNGGVWRPLRVGYTFQDAGYHVIPISPTPRTFLAASLAA